MFLDLQQELRDINFDFNSILRKKGPEYLMAFIEKQNKFINVRMR
jgi:hypothetical protein